MRKQRFKILGALAVLIVAASALFGQFVNYEGRNTTHVFKSIILSGTTRGEITGPEITRGSATSITVPGLASSGTVALTGTTNISGTVSLVRTSQQYQLAMGSAKAGATAGWTVAAGANLYEWTMAAGGTASTLVIPVDGLKVGDTITAYSCQAQIESAGNTATLDTNLRKLTNAAADPTDASVDSTTQVSVTADTASAPSKTLGTPEVVAANERFYILVTGTTAASTDIRMLGCDITVTTS